MAARVSFVVNLNVLILYKFSCLCVFERGWWVGEGIFMFSMRLYFCASMCVDAVNVCMSLCKFFVVVFVSLLLCCVFQVRHLCLHVRVHIYACRHSEHMHVHVWLLYANFNVISMSRVHWCMCVRVFVSTCVSAHARVRASKRTSKCICDYTGI